MISREELGRVARLKGLSLGNAERDYLLDIALLSISRSTRDELVFKGGTCLYKFYKLDRFSGDIDFTLRKRLDVDGLLDRIVSDMGSFGMGAALKGKKTAMGSVMVTIRAKGPLYAGTPQSVSGIRIDINLKSSIDKEPKVADYSSLYPDIPSFTLPIMDETEILAEKARAVMTRAKARDVYDLWYLLGKGVKFDTNLVNEKLKYYGGKWDPDEFGRRLGLKKQAWETELRPLVPMVPDFEGVREGILKAVSP